MYIYVNVYLCKYVNFIISKVKDDLANKASIFSIIPNLDENALNMQVDLTGQKIALLLPKETFSIYKNMEKSIFFRLFCKGSVKKKMKFFLDDTRLFAYNVSSAFL